MIRRLVVAAALLAVAGCTKGGGSGGSQVKSAGHRIAEDGEVAKVTSSPDGAWVAFLGQVERPKVLGVPEGIFVGTLELVPADGSSSARQLLGGVTSLEGSFGFSPDSQVLAAINGFRFATHSGTLEAVKVSARGDPVHLADDATSFLFSPDSKHLAWVAAAGAFLGDGDGANARKLTEGAATVEFSRDGKLLLVRKQASAGGDLLVVDVAARTPPRALATNVGDYVFSPDGKDVAFTTHAANPKGGWDLKIVPARGGQPRQLGEAVSRFAFSPDGKWLGYIGGVTPSKAFGDLYVAPVEASAGTRVGERVEQFQFAPGTQAVAFLERYDSNARSGTLALQTLPLGASPQILHKPCSGFGWSPKGNYLAYTALVLKPAVSVDLELLALKDLKPGSTLGDGGLAWATGARQIATGVFGYDFIGEDRLLYRSECIMEGRACDLYVVPTATVATPARLTGGVWRFSISKDGQRMLVTYPRFDSETVADLGALNLSGYGGVAGIDKSVELGAVFTDVHGDRAAYGVIDKKRRGVYVAEVPLPPAGQLPPSMEPPGFKATYATSGTSGTK